MMRRWLATSMLKKVLGDSLELDCVRWARLKKKQNNFIILSGMCVGISCKSFSSFFLSQRTCIPSTAPGESPEELRLKDLANKSFNIFSVF